MKTKRSRETFKVGEIEMGEETLGCVCVGGGASSIRISAVGRARMGLEGREAGEDESWGGRDG